jgi:methionyl-tRNA synthetase
METGECRSLFLALKEKSSTFGSMLLSAISQRPKSGPSSKANLTLGKKYWLDEKTNYVQFIGKDNIPFHAVFFPAMEMGQKVPYKTVDELLRTNSSI